MGMHRWRGYDHPTLHDMINSGPGAAASTPQTAYWEGLQAELSEIDADLNRKLGELNTSWEGAAGESANAGLTPLQQWAADAESGASGMRASTEYQADIVSRARAEMPEPVAVTTPQPSGWQMAAAGAALLTGNPGPAAVVAGQAMDHEAQEAKQDAASQKAVDTMDSYQSSSEFNRNTLGTFVPPPDVVVSTPAPATQPGGAIGGFTNQFSGTGHNGSSTVPSGYTPPPSTGHNNFVAPTGNVGNVGYTPVGTPTNPAGYVPPATTTPNGWTPPQFTPTNPTPGQPSVPVGQTGGNPPSFNGNLPVNNNGVNGPNNANPGAKQLGTGPGGKPGGMADDLGRRGAPGGQGGLGQGGVGQAGESRPGMGGKGTGAGQFAQHGANATGGRGGGAAGKGGMGAGGMGGRGAEGEEDEEYQLADYLVETEDVFGDDRVVAPGVIGEATQQ
ncbi:PPE domain-containing protein [Actinokineospora sp. HUAS TT18]|uniref:PPE domain-containing protein n=1 Tax=Actinokineospora sp. HUAS TT18 TaxID=3447451 RepID=UPI003F51DDEF